MRKDLEVEPINFYSSYSQMIDKASNTYLYLENGSIAGAVSCYENEIDDLFVDKAFQRQGVRPKTAIMGNKSYKTARLQ